jgi:hypothetical protein
VNGLPKALKFYDLKKKKSFVTEKYKVVTVKGRKAALATAPSGVKAYRFLPK